MVALTPRSVVIYADYHLLDRQVIDSEGHFVCKVDDLEFIDEANELGPLLANVLVGPAAVGPRLGGRLGEWFVAARRRFSQDKSEEPARFPFGLVDKIDNAVHVSVPRKNLHVEATEDWVREHLIGRIPGAARRPNERSGR